MLRIRKPALVLGVVSLVAGCAVWYFAPSLVANPVRPIAVRLDKKERSFPTPGKVDVYHSLAEAQAAFPRQKLSLARPVDFSREKLVHVAWRAVGCYTDEMKNSGRPTPLFRHLA